MAKLWTRDLLFARSSPRCHFERREEPGDEVGVVSGKFVWACSSLANHNLPSQEVYSLYKEKQWD